MAYMRCSKAVCMHLGPFQGLLPAMMEAYLLFLGTMTMFIRVFELGRYCHPLSINAPAYSINPSQPNQQTPPAE